MFRAFSHACTRAQLAGGHSNLGAAAKSGLLCCADTGVYSSSVWPCATPTVWWSASTSIAARPALRNALHALGPRLASPGLLSAPQLLGGSSSSSLRCYLAACAIASRAVNAPSGPGRIRRGGCRGLHTTAAAGMQEQQQQPPPLTGPPAPNAATAAVAAAAGAGADVGAVRVAVGQMTACGDQAANLEVCSRLVQDAAAAGCRLLFLPECFGFIGDSPAQSLAAAQPLTGPLMDQYRQLARTHGLWLSLGGFQEVGPDPQHIYNTHVVVDDAGELAAVYRKIHLFDVDVPNGPLLMESRTTAPGSQAVVVDTPAGRLGLTTCYDLRFPELFAHLTWERGAQVLAVPSAFTVVTGAAHWEVLLRARAIECQAYVVAAAQAGRHNAKRESYGHAIIVDPWGSVIARLPDALQTGIAVAELQLGPAGLLHATRDRMPCRQHRDKGRAAYAHGQGREPQQPAPQPGM